MCINGAITSTLPTLPGPTSAELTPRRDSWQLPGLTGLRGLAVMAVIAYHLGYLPGGFIGVDLFFVLSGFLITTLLLRKTPHGVAGMRAWWARRIRRLTPAVAVVVLAVLVVFLTRSGIALDAFATMTWWQNWHLIAEGTPYWAGTPSPLRHAWSLSIEEQFYLLWPPILLGIVAVGRRLGRPAATVAVVAAAGSAASFAWAAWLSSGTGVDLSRVYFGTDTRAGGLLAGCALAAWRHRRPDRWRRPAAIGVGQSWTAVLATVVLAALCLTLAPESGWTYRGGLLLATASSLLLVVACTGPGPITNSLSVTPLQWLGTRSYAIYLWSWPTQVALQERWPELPLGVVAIVTLLVSLGLSEVSMRLVERPLRYRSGWAGGAVPRRAAWGSGTIALIAVMVVAAGATVQTPTEVLAEQFEKAPDPTTSSASRTQTAPTSAPDGSTGPDAPSAPATTTTACVPTTSPTPQFGGTGGVFDPSTVEAMQDPTGSGCAATRVMVVGDSTGRGAANGLRRNAAGSLEVWDRTVLGCGLQATKAKCPSWRTIWPQAVQQVAPQTVLVHLGVSDDLIEGREPGFMTPEASQLRQQVLGEAMDALSAGGARVVWVLPSVPTDQGTFYCGGARRGTGCDPAWITRWNADVSAAAAPRGVAVVDLDAWVSSRGRATADRPDGLHLSGAALDAEAAWLAPQLR